MSSIMRRRNGLMGFSLIGGSCLEGGVLDPSILKTEHPPRHPRSIKMVTGPHTATSVPLSPARAGSFYGPSLHLPRNSNIPGVGGIADFDEGGPPTSLIDSNCTESIDCGGSYGFAAATLSAH